MIESIKTTSQESIIVQPSTERQTPPDAKAKFGAIMKQSALVLLGAASSVASALPAGGVLSAAVTGAAAAASSVQGASGQAAPGGGSGLSGFDQMKMLQEQGFDSSMEVLKIQQAISQENRVFSTLSNVLKARHETARTAINNIR